ncbi:MAG: hypothetical protein KatS3mg121_0424 [Gammaproteobacteria bacterium]|nr:MAG: hypothetical protein KatS3mg121_0424 [Gammaproteobacteria bacterium]
MNAARPAGLLRRLGALFYDALLLGALWLVAAVPAVLLHGGAIRRGDGAAYWLFELYLAGVALAFFTFCWSRGGQTLGMAAWGLRVEDAAGRPPAWPRALLRAALALGGLANLCLLVGLRPWHERLSGTYTVHRPAARRRPESAARHSP